MPAASKAPAMTRAIFFRSLHICSPSFAAVPILRSRGREVHLGSAQIGALDGGVGLQGRRRALADDAAGLDEVAAVGDVEALLGVLLHQQDADAGGADAGQRAEQLAAYARRESERRLVEQEDVGR